MQFVTEQTNQWPYQIGYIIHLMSDSYVRKLSVWTKFLYEELECSECTSWKIQI